MLSWLSRNAPPGTIPRLAHFPKPEFFRKARRGQLRRCDPPRGQRESASSASYVTSEPMQDSLEDYCLDAERGTMDYGTIEFAK
jgi:hypothetical protein